MFYKLKSTVQQVMTACCFHCKITRTVINLKKLVFYVFPLAGVHLPCGHLHHMICTKTLEHQFYSSVLMFMRAVP